MKKTIKSIILGASLFLLIGCGNNQKNQDNTNTNEASNKPEKTYKIGISQIVDHPALNDAKKGFQDAITKSGLKVEYDDKNANKEISTQTIIMQQFNSDKKDLVYAISTPTAQAAMAQLDSKTPIVFASVTDPAGAGLTGKSNITGTSGAPEIEKNLQLIKEAFPNAKKIGVLYNSSEQNSISQLKTLTNLATKYNVEIISESATNANEMIQATDKISSNIDVFYALQDNTLVSYFPNLLDKLNEKKIPIMGSNILFSQLGGLIAQGATDYEIGYRAGEMAVEILKNGKKPSDINIETVQKLKIIINKQNMELLGIKLPDAILKQANIN